MNRGGSNVSARRGNTGSSKTQESNKRGINRTRQQPTRSVTKEDQRDDKDTFELLSGRDVKLDKEKLAEENIRLTKELESIKDLYQQLVREGPVEKYEERRVHLLKSQVIQLERQVMLQSDVLSKRSLVLLEVENSLERTVQQLRELLSLETPGPTVAVERSQLTRLIEDTEGARRRLYKNTEAADPKNLARPVLFIGEFLKTDSADESPVSLYEVCRGNLEHLNLRHVAKLESKLFSLLKKLLILQNNVSTYTKTDQSSVVIQLPTSDALLDRSTLLITEVLPLLSECCQSLIDLSVLVPSAPWPSLKKSVRPEVTSANILAALPSFPRSKQKQAQAVIDALLKANIYSQELSKLEYRACAEELKFHQEVYELQMEYNRAVFDALKEAYLTFEKDMRDTICIPLSEIVENFNTLKESSSEGALKSFLSSFKTHNDKLEHLLKSLQPDQSEAHHEGVEVLSEYGKNFFTKVDILIKKYSRKRRELLEKAEELKQLRDIQLDETVDMLTVRKETEGGNEPST
ncbi:hypothetical protein HOLleu_13544 [Holothuria leucospilota]|uniref:Uncharacterized protein n=1 Tax=Holothuria leucospilota TaxID=206669 RepID=A0A9Q1HDS4_HOLLE|nr:hypothetical protein HOLleu_13544 [Holothuria leucospilota]